MLKRQSPTRFPEVPFIAEGVLDFDAITKLLSYTDSKLANTRFNA